jgi:hypothetical protein
MRQETKALVQIVEQFDLLREEFQVGLDRSEIDVLGITSWRRGMVIVWHSGGMPEEGF